MKARIFQLVIRGAVLAALPLAFAAGILSAQAQDAQPGDQGETFLNQLDQGEQFLGPGEQGQSGDEGVSPIPEPETYAMLLAGLGLIAFIARRRKNLRNPAA
jgi:hypothetical protein